MQPTTTQVPSIQIHPEGPRFSRLVYGTWRLLDGEECANLPPLEPELPSAGTAAPSAYQPIIQQVSQRIRRCIDLGITSFDLADIYGGGGHQCERIFGWALQQASVDRHQLQLISKCNILFPAPSFPHVQTKHYDSTEAYILKRVDETLTAVFGGPEKGAYLDLLLLHRPDFLLDCTEVAHAFMKLHAAGKVRHFGVSNYTPSQFDMLQTRLHQLTNGKLSLVTNQVEASVLELQCLYDGTFDQCQKYQMSPMIWSPLAGGRLFKPVTTPAAQQTPAEQKLTRLQSALKQLAAKKRCTIDQLAYLFLLKLPSKGVIILGTNSLDRVETAARCFQSDMELTRQEWYGLLEAVNGCECP